MKAALQTPILPLLLLPVVRDIHAMFRKSLPRALRATQRSFSSSAPARRVVATNPVKAQEVQVRLPRIPPWRGV